MGHSPRVNCPICGKRLLGERNVRMHTLAAHPQPDEDAIIAAEGIRPEVEQQLIQSVATAIGQAVQ